jgi:hypothetical protein
MGSVLPNFARCLKSLRNIRTLQICFIDQAAGFTLGIAFGGVEIPSLRTILLPGAAHHILRSCPNVEDVTCIDSNGDEILRAIAARCPKVMRISGVDPSLEGLKSRLIRFVYCRSSATD